MSKNTTQIKAAIIREKGGPFSIETLTLEAPRRDDTAGFRGSVKNWRSTLTMHASAAEYRSLHLRAHELRRDVPLYDVSSVDLPGGGSGRTIADIRTLQSATPPSHIATFLYGLRYLLGRVFGWDREPMRPEDSFLERLSQRDRCDSELTPGTLDGHFWVLYEFPGEALRETRNKTVHGFICTARVSSLNGYILYWAVYVLRASWLTRPYLVAIEPFRRVCISYASPHSSRVNCCLRRHEPKRYCRLMGDSASGNISCQL